MKNLIANLLLVAGVIVASIAAGESRRVSKTISLDGDFSGEALYAPVPGLYETGTPVTADVVAYFRDQGVETISVLRQPKPTETLDVTGTTALARVLSKAVILKAETEEARVGRLLHDNFIERITASDLTSIQISYKPTLEEGSAEEPKRVNLTWDLVDDAKNPEGVTLKGCRLEESITVPIRLKESTFLDEPTLARLAASGFETVSVKIPMQFSWQSWGMRWIFVLGAILTLAGVLLKRSKADISTIEAGATSVAALVTDLIEVEEAVVELAGRSAQLDAEELHKAVDPLLTGPIYRFAEGRESIRTAHGGATYIAVMDAFARGERKLNRTWSAAVDGHAPEARASLEAALSPLSEAREALPGAALLHD